MDKLKAIEAKYKETPDEALALINKLLSEEGSSKEALMLRAEIYQALNRNTDAVNDYIEILKTYGDDEYIKNRKTMLETIISMTQLDIYACTNLHNDPWE